MTRFWVIAPFSAKNERFSDVWEFDRTNGVISIGWGELGDVSQLDLLGIRSRYIKLWPKESAIAVTQCSGMVYKFTHEIQPGDVVIARWGTKYIAGVGTVKRAAYYDPKKLKALFKSFGPEYTDVPFYYHLDVEWDPDHADIWFDSITFGMQTLYETTADKYQEWIGSAVEDDSRDLKSSSSPLIFT